LALQTPKFYLAGSKRARQSGFLRSTGRKNPQFEQALRKPLARQRFFCRPGYGLSGEPLAAAYVPVDFSGLIHGPAFPGSPAGEPISFVENYGYMANISRERAVPRSAAL
jgi:hypothetical protein